MTKKTILIGALVTVVVVAAGYLYLRPSVGSNTTISSVATTTPAVATKTKAQEIVKVPYDASAAFNKNAKPLRQAESFTNPVTGDVVAFTPLTGPDHQFNIPDSEVSVNGRQVDTIGGAYMSNESFSPDGNYFAFRTSATCGAACTSYGLQVVDLRNGRVLLVKYPKPSFNLNYSKYVLYEAIPFSESYSWSVPHNLNYVFYFIGSDASNTFRVSPKENWSVDLSTGKNTPAS